MKQILEIGRKELRMLMFSPLGWLVIITIIVQLGSFFISNLSSRTSRLWSIMEFTPSLTFNMLFSGGIGLITGIASQLYLYIPLLTMGLLSREYHEGTIKLLYSSPVSIKQMVFGKFLSLVAIGLIFIGIVGAGGLLLHFFVIQQMDLGLMLWGLFILFLLICTYGAIGLFVSSLTSYQFVAALGAVGVLFLLEYSGNFSSENAPEMITSVLSWLQGTTVLNRFRGYIGTWDVFYFLLLIGMFLGLTYVRLQSIRQSASVKSRVVKYFGVVALTIILGYISSRPSLKYYYDVRKPVLTDTKIMIDRNDLSLWRVMLMQVVPASFIVTGILIIWRRRSR